MAVEAWEVGHEEPRQFADFLDVRNGSFCGCAFEMAEFEVSVVAESELCDVEAAWADPVAGAAAYLVKNDGATGAVVGDFLIDSVCGAGHVLGGERSAGARRQQDGGRAEKFEAVYREGGVYVGVVAVFRGFSISVEP